MNKRQLYPVLFINTTIIKSSLSVDAILIRGGIWMELSSNIVFDTRDILCKFISTKLKCEKWFKFDLESNRNTSYCVSILVNHAVQWPW